MSTKLTVDDLDQKLREKVTTQDYASTSIKDVKIISITNYVGEGGDFSELMRITNGESEVVPGFKLEQISRAKVIPGSIKAWHIHLNQTDVWYVAPDSQLFVGLWDIRENSETNGVKMRLNIGGGNSKLVVIPPGVAHGCANFTNEDVDLVYFTSEKFNSKNPDEKRLPWNEIPNFWEPTKD